MTRNSSQLIVLKAPETVQEFVALGAQEFAYVRHLTASDVRQLFPQVPPMAPGLSAFAVFAADGTPVSLADSRAAAMASARSNDLSTVSIH